MNVSHITAKLDFGTREKEQILIVLNAVDAACSAIKGSAIKDSEMANGIQERYFCERRCYCPGPRERMSQCPPSCRTVDKCTRNLTRSARVLSLAIRLSSRSCVYTYSHLFFTRMQVLRWSTFLRENRGRIEKTKTDVYLSRAIV